MICLRDRGRDRRRRSRSAASRARRRRRPAGCPPARSDEPGRVRRPGTPVSAVPVLPATWMPGICAAVPVPPWTTASIICVQLGAVCGLIARPSLCGFVSRTVEPSGDDHAADEVAAASRRRRSRSSRRPSPSAAASPACRSWPNASRPGSTWSSARVGSNEPVRVRRRGRSARARPPASRAAASSRSRTASRSRGSCAAPSCLPMLQKTELIECWSACSEVTLPKTSGPLWSGCRRSRPACRTRCSSRGRRTSSRGVNAPVSSAAAAVTILNVEPGVIEPVRRAVEQRRRAGRRRRGSSATFA